jgi:endonuclease/exonuclease/phosphatase family metal-dependent hydrolase
MGYVFANYHLVLAPGDSAELDTREPNHAGLHGAALFTRWPVRRVVTVGLPEFTDKFHAIEKRLGTKRALLCELDAPGGPLTVAVVHLDPFAPPSHRAHQLRSVIAAVDRMGTERVLIGGDFNTNTYHLGSKLGLGVDIAHKLARFGFSGTIEQYMTPERVFERGVFGVLAASGFAREGFTDPRAGTLHYDLRDPEVREKSLQYLPGFVFRWLERKLRRWDGCVPMRIDHFAGRGLRPLRALTLPRDMPHGRVSDHAPIVVEFTSA